MQREDRNFFCWRKRRKKEKDRVMNSIFSPILASLCYGLTRTDLIEKLIENFGENDVCTKNRERIRSA